MTLAQFFDYLSGHPLLTLAFFVFPPAMALCVGHLGRGRGYEAPWRYAYAALIYAVCIPGLLALALLVYLFLFERMSVYDVNLLTTFVPIASMTATLVLIRHDVDLDYVPGFGRLSGLMAVIFGLICLMYAADRTRVIMFSYLPFAWVLVGFVAVVALMGWGMRKIAR